MQAKRFVHHPLLIPLTVALILLSILLWLGAPQPAAAETALAPAIQAELPPTLVATTPADGTTWAGEAVIFTFDQPIDPASAATFTVEPAIAGALRIEGNRVTFTAESPPVGGERYQFTLDADAVGTNGLPLGTPATIVLVGATPLAVTSTQPSDGAVDVSVDNQIVIVFNQPVVELVGIDEQGIDEQGIDEQGIDEQADLPQPLTLEPAVAGTGQWLNTSIYLFQPTLGLAGGTDYTATINGDLTRLEGQPLGTAHTIRFSTAAPTVVDVQPRFANPYHHGPIIGPDSTFHVAFSQPMDPESTEAAFALTAAGAGDPVAGAMGWSPDQRTLLFTPTMALDFGATYELSIDTTAQPISRQGNLRQPHSSTFTVVPLPAATGSIPAQGATNVPPDMSVKIQFNTVLSETSLLANISVTPTLTTTQIASYYRSWENVVEVNWFREADTTYTVTVGSDVVDLYGNPLGEPYSFSFTTGDHSAFVRMGIERFTHFSAYTETRVSTLYRNVSSVEARLYTLPIAELLHLGGENQWEAWQNYQVPDPATNLLWERSYEPIVGPNVTARQIITLTDRSGELLPPGLYMLEVTHPDQAPSEEQSDPFANPTQAVVILSNNNLTLKKSLSGASLAWLTDLQRGEPVADVPLRFYQGRQLLDDATTDGEGIAVATLQLNPDQSWVPVIAMSGTPGEANFAAASSEWNQGIAPWDFDISGGYDTEAYQSHFYTDRPIYRPGQTIYWKGIVRRLVDEQYQLPATELPIQIIVRDDQGNTVLEENHTPNDIGTLNGEVTLAPEAGTGFYYIEAQLQIDAARSVYGGTGFQVAAYRKPEFEIDVTSDQAEYQSGDTMEVTVQANYFSGSPLANAPLTWRLIAEPYFFHWQAEADNRSYSFTPFDPEREQYDPYRSIFGRGINREGSGKTNADGSFTLELPADLSMALQSQRWTIDVTVQSSTNQFVSGRTTVPVHKGEYYIGLSPRRYVAQVGTESEIDLLTIAPVGIPYPGAEVDVTIHEFVWNSVYAQSANGSFAWQTSVERTPVYTTSVLTGRSGDATISWSPTAGGQYQTVATSTDDQGNQISSATFVWVSGDAFVAWPRENNDRIELVADKELYTPGERAAILVPSPFTGTVEALLTVERGGVLSATVISLAGNSATLEIPITSDSIPNIFVSLVLVKGIDASNPTPAMRIGYVQLNVDTAEKRLAIEVTPAAAEVRPGENVTYTLTVQDERGAAAAQAEVSVALVDKAVLSLVEQFERPLLDIFYLERPLGVTTGATLNINLDRLSQQLSEGAKGGGGGGGGPGLIDVREEFPDIAFWQADLVTDGAGQVTFSVPLPDNLTTWTLAAKAVTTATLVGETTHDLVATKALQIRPLLPRFFTAGDRAQVGAAVVNAAAATLEAGELDFTLEGATLDAAAEAATFTLAQDAQERFLWPITIDQETTAVTFTFTARATASDATPGNGAEADDDELTDAVRVTVPVQQYRTPEIVGTTGTVPPTGRLEAIRLPAGASEEGELVVTVEPSLAAGMQEGLRYLQHYRYESNEQTVSRFLPNLFTMRAYNTLGVTDRALERTLNNQVEIGVQRLRNRQNDDGGWGYWPGEASNPFITSYVLWGLHHATTLDYSVPKRTIIEAANYLDRQFEAPQEVEQAWRLNEMAFINFVLSELALGDPGRAVTLYAERERLDYYGQALLAMTLSNLDAEETLNVRVQTLLDNLYGAAQLSATGASWHEGDTDWWTLSTDTRTTSMVLAAFVRLDPSEPLLPMVVRWLMSAREAGRWATTQENAWALIALADWMAATGELSAEYTWSVTLNEQELGSGNVGPDNLDVAVELGAAVSDLLRDEANALRFERDRARGELYYTTHLRYYLDPLAIDARDRGLVVDRRFMLDGQAVDGARVGDVISVTVTLVAPRDLYQALVEVPIPAGTEPIDPRLATTTVQYDEQGQLIPIDSGRPWWWWTPTNIDVYDDRVALMATYLPAGTYEYTFQVQATVPGDYRVLPVHGEMIYFPEVWGRSAGALFVVSE